MLCPSVDNFWVQVQAVGRPFRVKSDSLAMTAQRPLYPAPPESRHRKIVHVSNVSQAESNKIPSGDYPHEPHACGLIPCLSGVTVFRSRAGADESKRRDVVFAPRRRA
jgi:hypothetical protein